MRLCSLASSCCRTTFSVIFDIKERLETSRKFFFKLFAPREAFLRRGLTTTDLKVDGKVPDDKKKFMMFVRVGSRSSRNSRSDVGRGSNEQDVGFDFKIVAFSSDSVIG